MTTQPQESEMPRSDTTPQGQALRAKLVDEVRSFLATVKPSGKNANAGFVDMRDVYALRGRVLEVDALQDAEPPAPTRAAVEALRVWNIGTTGCDHRDYLDRAAVLALLPSADAPDMSREVVVRLMDNEDDPSVVHLPYPECSIGEPHRNCNVYHRRPSSDAPAAGGPGTSDTILRRLVWLSHAATHPGLLPYGDDGEMQCCGIDFKRADPQDIHDALSELAWKRMSALPPAVPAPEETTP